MHERSLVASLICQIDEELRRRHLHRLAEVRLAIGEFAGVEPGLLAWAFEELAAEHWEEPPHLRCDIIPLTACCRTCSRAFAVNRFQFACPACGSRRVEITAGEELQLVSLRAEPLPPLMDATP